MITPNTRGGPRQPEAGSCRWVGRVDAAELDCGRAILWVATARGGAHYWVTRHVRAGRVAAYTLAQFPAGAVYAVDAGPGPADPRRWSCNCPEGPGGCEHARALAAALRDAGLV